ncbi:MAG: enoyl-CoA hydratase [Acidobacteria bacterium]|nr:enoyl-CoA hydratase [Acidobacteriota bacterium]
MEKLLITSKDGIKRITFNTPERRNAVDPEMMEGLLEAVRETAQDATKVVILTGAGDAFCAGANVKGMHSRAGEWYDVTAQLRRVSNPTIQALREMPQPVIARIHGPAVGIGCNYALAADIRIASTGAQFGQVFSKIGLIPDGGGTYLLPRLVGYAAAFELMVTGEVINAERALALGMVSRVVPLEQLDEVVEQWAARLAAGPSVALAGIKKALLYGETHTLAESLDFEAVTQAACFGSQDFREGVAAFVEKRKPVFQGR